MSKRSPILNGNDPPPVILDTSKITTNRIDASYITATRITNPVSRAKGLPHVIPAASFSTEPPSKEVLDLIFGKDVVEEDDDPIDNLKSKLIPRRRKKK